MIKVGRVARRVQEFTLTGQLMVTAELLKSVRDCKEAKAELAMVSVCSWVRVWIRNKHFRGDFAVILTWTHP